MNLDLGIHYSPTTVKAQTTNFDIELKLHNNGWCGKCKIQTHERKALLGRWIPVTNEHVLRGRCLICYPLPFTPVALSAALPASPAPNTSGVATISAIAPPASACARSIQAAAFAVANPSSADAENFVNRSTDGMYRDVMMNWEKRCTCQRKTHTLDSLGRWIPLNSEYVLDGWCLKCILLSSSPALSATTSASPAPNASGVATASADQATVTPAAVVIPSSSAATAEHVFDMIYRSADGRDWGRYTGRIDANSRRPHGYGVFTLANGDTYNGEWNDGKRHVHGVYTWANGNKYHGEWKEDKRNGSCSYTWANGDKYDGEYKDNKRNGRGVYTCAYGDKYDGEFKDDNRHGRGVFTWANGNTYDGEYKDGKRHGRGVHTCAATGRTEKQKWVNGTQMHWW
jgi:hypothetical protein